MKPDQFVRYSSNDLCSITGNKRVFDDHTYKCANKSLLWCQLYDNVMGLCFHTGTMGNLICVMTHCWGRGAEVILGDKSHIHVYEQGGIAQVSSSFIVSKPAFLIANLAN